MAPDRVDGPGFSVAAAHADGVMVIRVRGELDLATAPELDLAVADAVGLRPNRMVIDLGGVTFMDSTGCRSLVRAHQATGKATVEMHLRRVSPISRRTLEIMHIDDLFTFVDPDPPGSD
jgi:anti-sigma B factor antagonist